MTRCIWFVALVLFIPGGCATREEPPVSLSGATGEIALFAPGLVSTYLNERDMAIAPNGNEIIYTLGNFNQSQRCLVTLKRIDGHWLPPKILPFSGTHQDLEPFFAPDGSHLYFVSNRPIDSVAEPDRSDYNIWVVRKSTDGWEEPAPMDTIINTRGDEFYPSVVSNGSLYFTASRESGWGREDIYISRRSAEGFRPPVPLDSTINSGAYEFNAYVSPDEGLIIFSSYGRADGLGGGDLYYSIKNRDGNWETARNFGPDINSGQLDYCPYLDLPRRTFYFSSNRQSPGPDTYKKVKEFQEHLKQIENGLDNIYRIQLDAIPSLNNSL